MQTSGPSQKLAGCPATFLEEDGCPATAPFYSYSVFTVLHTEGTAPAQCWGMLPLSVAGSCAGAAENAFHAILLKAINLVDYITLVWEQVL